MLKEIIQLDYQIMHYINIVWTNPLFDLLMPLLRNKWTWLPLYVFILALIFWKNKKNTIQILLLVILAVSLTDYISSTILKEYFERIRPCALNDSFNQFRILIPCSNGYSFPSSHASNHMCLAILFATITIHYFKKKWIWIPFISWGLLISYAQIYVGVHFPLDVIFGMSIGIITGITARILLNKYIFKTNYI
ncbi:MAG: phosphatase PAP2 family protein [Bacteroidota bacterium]